MDGMDGYIIRGLMIENFKRVVLIDINPDGTVIELRGKNEQGKSSIIDAIWVGCCGLRVAPEQPIRTGATSARIVITLGPPGDDDPNKHVIITRKFSADKRPSLTVQAAGSPPWRREQELLDALIGALAFDPLAFSRLKEGDRLAELAKVSGLDLDAIARIDDARKSDYDQRRDYNRDAAQRRGQADGIQYPEDLPATPVDVAEIAARARRVAQANEQLTQQRAERQRVAQEIAIEQGAAQRKREEADQLRRRAELLEEEAGRILSSIEARHRQIDTAPLAEPVDMQPLFDEMQKANDTNRYIQERQRREELEKEVAELQEKSAALTKSIAARDTEKAALIASAKMPVEELAVDGGGVMLGGVPWDQASQAQKIVASTAIAMAANPKLRIVCVRDGSLLDKEHLELLAETCQRRGYQLWIEITDNNAKVGFVIEDGTARLAAPAEQESLSLV